MTYSSSSDELVSWLCKANPYAVAFQVHEYARTFGVPRLRPPQRGYPVPHHAMFAIRSVFMAMDMKLSFTMHPTMVN